MRVVEFLRQFGRSTAKTGTSFWPPELSSTPFAVREHQHVKTPGSKFVRTTFDPLNHAAIKTSCHTHSMIFQTEIDFTVT